MGIVLRLTDKLNFNGLGWVLGVKEYDRIKM